jgi:hypothetical protein
MKYRVRSSFSSAKATFKPGQILTEAKVSNWKNLKSLINAGFLECLLEVEDNGTPNAKT